MNYGNLLISLLIELRSGLSIGSGTQGLGRGDYDLLVVRDAKGWPDIPGSTLRGKMRSIMELNANLPANKRVGKNVQIHECMASPACDICVIFGVSASVRTNAGRSRLKVDDFFLTPESKKWLTEEIETDGLGTVTKTEVVIQRDNGASSPRTLERVPEGAIFQGGISYAIQEIADLERIKLILAAMDQTQDEGLGGCSCRGYGKVLFTITNISFKTPRVYQGEEDPLILISAPTAVEEVVKQFNGLFAPLRGKIGG